MRKYATITILLTCILVLPGAGATASHTTEERRKKVEDAISNMKEDGVLPELDRTSSLEGKDSDHDGIRDDIEQYLEGAPLTDSERKGLRRIARGFQRIQSASNMTRNKAKSIAQKLGKNYLCAINESNSPEKIREIKSEVHLYTTNTKERHSRFNEYDQFLAGFVFKLPSEDECLNSD